MLFAEKLLTSRVERMPPKEAPTELHLQWRKASFSFDDCAASCLLMEQFVVPVGLCRPSATIKECKVRKLNHCRQSPRHGQNEVHFLFAVFRLNDVIPDPPSGRLSILSIVADVQYQYFQ